MIDQLAARRIAKRRGPATQLPPRFEQFDREARAPPSATAAARPAKPPPTIATRGAAEVVGRAHGDTVSQLDSRAPGDAAT